MDAATRFIKFYSDRIVLLINFSIHLKHSVMAKGKNLKPAKVDLKAKKQEKILRRLEEKKDKKRKSRV